MAIQIIRHNLQQSSKKIYYSFHFKSVLSSVILYWWNWSFLKMTAYPCHYIIICFTTNFISISSTIFEAVKYMFFHIFWNNTHDHFTCMSHSNTITNSQKDHSAHHSRWYCLSMIHLQIPKSFLQKNTILSNFKWDL